MSNENFAYDIILTPVITEKSTNLSSLNKVTFKVSKTASLRKMGQRQPRTFKGHSI